jgi:uncharacterized BrkB/YihY/UPF0761 family membrane protein
MDKDNKNQKVDIKNKNPNDDSNNGSKKADSINYNQMNLNNENYNDNNKNNLDLEEIVITEKKINAIDKDKENKNKKAASFLRWTMLGGLFFLILKSVEYYFKIDEGYTIGYNTFFSFYWMLTLFHVIHVIVGLLILLSIYIGLKKEKITTSVEDFEASAAFWHLCDLIWLLLFPIIYLIF